VRSGFRFPTCAARAARLLTTTSVGGTIGAADSVAAANAARLPA